MNKTEVVHFTNAPEIKHFAVEKFGQNDNVYGIAWGNIVRKYLETGYKFPTKKNDVELDGKIYHVLDRGEITVFYDETGNTLFDVENARLEKEYQYISDEEQKDVKTDNEAGNGDVPAQNDKNSGEEEIIQGTEKSDNGGENDTKVCSNIQKVEEATGENSIKAESKANPKYTGVDGAIAKLQESLKNAKDKTFSKKIIDYLITRCRESESLANDICQEHKTWDKCISSIYSRAQKVINGHYGMVPDEEVYEWAEDYYHKDDKEEEKKAKEREKKQKEESKKCDASAKRAQEKTKKASKDKARADYDTTLKSNTDNHKLSDNETAEDKAKQVHKVKKSGDIDGQMDIFSFMGM